MAPDLDSRAGGGFSALLSTVLTNPTPNSRRQLENPCILQQIGNALMARSWLFPYAIICTIIVGIWYIALFLRGMNAPEYVVDVFQLLGWYTAFLYWCLTSVDPGFVPVSGSVAAVTMPAGPLPALHTRSLSTPIGTTGPTSAPSAMVTSAANGGNGNGNGNGEAGNSLSLLVGLSSLTLRVPQETDQDSDSSTASPAPPLTPYPPDALDDVAGLNSPSGYCPICSVPRPPRAHHCRDCNRCVDVRDHHCIWLGTCVGRNNFRLFFQFTFLCLAQSVLLMMLTLYYYFIYGNQATKYILNDDSLPHARRLELVKQFNNHRLSIFHFWPTFILSSIGGFISFQMLGRVCRTLVTNVTWLEEHRKALQQQQLQSQIQIPPHAMAQAEKISGQQTHPYSFTGQAQANPYAPAPFPLPHPQSPTSIPTSILNPLPPQYPQTLDSPNPLDGPQSPSSLSQSVSTDSEDSIQSQMLTSKLDSQRNVDRSRSSTKVFGSSLIFGSSNQNGSNVLLGVSDESTGCIQFFQQVLLVICPPPSAIYDSVVNTRLVLGLPVRGISTPKMILETLVLLLVPPMRLIWNSIRSTCLSARSFDFGGDVPANGGVANGGVANGGTTQSSKLPTGLARVCFFLKRMLGLLKSLCGAPLERKKGKMTNLSSGTAAEYERFGSMNGRGSYEDL